MKKILFVLLTMVTISSVASAGGFLPTMGYTGYDQGVRLIKIGPTPNLQVGDIYEKEVDTKPFNLEKELEMEFIQIQTLDKCALI